MKNAAATRGKDAQEGFWETRCLNIALESFRHLRNLDFHNESLHTVIGMRYRVIGNAEVFTELQTKISHVHQVLAHEGIGLAPWALEDTEELKNQPGIVGYLTESSILQLCHADVHEMLALFKMCSDENIIELKPQMQICSICAKDALKAKN